jgi:hypothetical protein
MKKYTKPPCGHSMMVADTQWGEPWSCITPWPGTSFGSCSACGAQMQRVDETDEHGTVRTVWQAIPRRRVMRKPRQALEGAVCLPLCSDAELVESQAPV